MFITLQPHDTTRPPQLVNIAHMVALTGETLKLSTGETIRLTAESVLKLHTLLPQLEG